MRYLLAYHTDKGKRKKVNQDSLLLIRGRYQGKQMVLAVVCDGMGGYKSGETASAEVVCAFSEWLREEFCALSGKEEFEDALYSSWERLLQKEHDKIQDYGKEQGIRLGTTATAMLLLQENYYIAHIGDSRIYEIKDQITQLTRDQILANLDTARRKGSGKEASNVPKNILLQGIGASRTIRPVYYSGKIKRDTVYLLCSDGFRHKVDNQELLYAFRPENLLDEEIMKRQGEHIVETVMERGEKDNISLLLIRTLREQNEEKQPIKTLEIEREWVSAEGQPLSDII